jgi:hypothetical protein
MELQEQLSVQRYTYDLELYFRRAPFEFAESGVLISRQSSCYACQRLCTRWGRDGGLTSKLVVLKVSELCQKNHSKAERETGTISKLLVGLLS